MATTPSRRIVAPATLLVTAAIGAVAMVVTLTAVPASGAGFSGIVSAPTTAAAVVVALAVALVAAAPGALAPLLVILAPLGLGGFAGAWTLAGPGAIVVAALAVATAARALLPRIVDTPRPRLHAAGAALVAAVWLGGVAAAVSPFAMTGDAPHYLTIARSVLDDGDFDLRNDYDERRYAGFYAGSLEPRHTNTSPWDEQFSFHGVGVALLVLPGFAAFGVAGAAATLVTVMALASALLWLAAWHLLRDAGAAWFGWAALVLSAPYALHAAAIYPDGPAAAAVVAGLWLTVRLQPDQRVPYWALAAAGAALATLPWLHVRQALPAGVLGVAIAWAIRRTQQDPIDRLAWFLAIPAISFAGWLASSQVMFGTWDPTAAMLQRTAPGGWSEMQRGLLGLLADHQYGLLATVPVMAAAAWAVPGFVRAFPLIGAATTAMSAGVLGMASAWVWWGGYSAPARFLVVIMPAAALWAAQRWSRAGSGGRRVLALLLALSAAITVSLAVFDGGARAYAFPDGHGSVFEAFSHSVDVSRALPSLFRDGETLRDATAQTLVWGAAGLAAAAVVFLLRSRDEGRATGVGALVVLVIAGLAAEAGWRVRGTPAWTPGTAALTLLHAAAAPAALPVAFDGWRPRVLDDVVTAIALRTPEWVPIAPPMSLYVPDVPAGEYLVRTTDTASRTALTLELGRDAGPWAQWTPPAPAPRLHLDAALHSVRVLGDDVPAGSLWLQPVRLARDAPRGQARRITRLGEVAVYSMDDSAYAEPGGLWAGGNRATRLLLAAEPSGTALDLRLVAGPADVEVTLTAEELQRTIALAANGTEVLRLDGHAPVVDLRLDVRGGFPAAALGAPSDSRTFGVWLEVRPAKRSAGRRRASHRRGAAPPPPAAARALRRGCGRRATRRNRRPGPSRRAA